VFFSFGSRSKGNPRALSQLGKGGTHATATSCEGGCACRGDSDSGHDRQQPGTLIVMSRFVLLTGTANPALAETIAREMSVPLGACTVDRHAAQPVLGRIADGTRTVS
jgi:hypothetical protein